MFHLISYAKSIKITQVAVPFAIFAKEIFKKMKFCVI